MLRIYNHDITDKVWSCAARKEQLLGDNAHLYPRIYKLFCIRTRQSACSTMVLDSLKIGNGKG